MASPAKITETLPDTLPEDFGEWDGGESPAAEPAAPGRTDAGSNSGGAKPASRPAATQSSIKPAADLLHGAPLPSPAKDYSDDRAFLNRVKSLKPPVERPSEVASRKPASAAAVVDAPAAPARPATPAPRKTQAAAQTAAMNEADEVLFQTFRSNATAPEVKVKEPAKKKWMLIGVAGGVPVLLLLLLMIPMFHHTKPAAAQPVAVPQPVTVTTDDQPDAASTVVKPSPSNSTQAPHAADVNSAKNAAADAAPAAKDDQQDAAAAPAPVASQMMNDQLNAPTRIQRAASTNDDAPPPASNFAMAGLGGNTAIGNVFGGDKTKVQVAQPTTVRVSAGVAVGLLMQKTAPVYPLIAKTARVSGTVVLQARISKTGAIEDLHVLSGPVMLRQSAMDAVRTWRYKPYKLNNEPTEIETTINVIFSLAG
jgi:protein TonB